MVEKKGRIGKTRRQKVGRWKRGRKPKTVVRIHKERGKT
jgi:hypothetical protein